MDYVYKQTEPGLYTVGFYSPDGEWHSASDHESSDEAANRVHWLNGGLGSPDAVSEERFQALTDRVNDLEQRFNDTERKIPVQVQGGIMWMTEKEYANYKGKKD